jgi:hypothetical protein
MIYSLDFDKYLAGHGVLSFTARELCPEGRRTPSGVALKAPPCELWGNIIPTLKVAEWLRSHFGTIVIVQSGYRDRLYNRAVGSTDASMHVQFRAMDIRLPGISSARVVAALETHPEASRMGIGSYSSFVHIDVRGSRARW